MVLELDATLEELYNGNFIEVPLNNKILLYYLFIFFNLSKFKLFKIYLSNHFIFLYFSSRLTLVNDG